MLLLRLLEFVIIALGMVFIMTQMIIPIFTGKKMFPLFDKKVVSSEEHLQDAKVDSEVAENMKATTEIYRDIIVEPKKTNNHKKTNNKRERST